MVDEVAEEVGVKSDPGRHEVVEEQEEEASYDRGRDEETLEDMHAGPEQGTDEKSQTDHSQIDYSIEIHG